MNLVNEIIEKGRELGDFARESIECASDERYMDELSNECFRIVVNLGCAENAPYDN